MLIRSMLVADIVQSTFAENELERKLRQEKVVASKQLRFTVEMEEERRARLENDTATKQLRLAMEMDEEEKQDWRMW